jgi:hypothetical protein
MSKSSIHLNFIDFFIILAKRLSSVFSIGA